MFKKQEFDIADKVNSLPDHDHDNDDVLEVGEVAFTEIKQLIESAKTEHFGFESTLLEYILCRFIQFGEDYERSMLKIFQRLFRNAIVKDYFESENRVDITLLCFEYIHVENDLFLPQSTTESFVKQVISDYFVETKSKSASISLQFLVH